MWESNGDSGPGQRVLTTRKLPPDRAMAWSKRTSRRAPRAVALCVVLAVGSTYPALAGSQDSDALPLLIAQQQLLAQRMQQVETQLTEARLRAQADRDLARQQSDQQAARVVDVQMGVERFGSIVTLGMAALGVLMVLGIGIGLLRMFGAAQRVAVPARRDIRDEAGDGADH